MYTAWELFSGVKTGISWGKHNGDNAFWSTMMAQKEAEWDLNLVIRGHAVKVLKQIGSDKHCMKLQERHRNRSERNMTSIQIESSS